MLLKYFLSFNFFSVCFLHIKVLFAVFPQLFSNISHSKIKVTYNNLVLILIISTLLLDQSQSLTHIPLESSYIPPWDICMDQKSKIIQLIKWVVKFSFSWKIDLITSIGYYLRNNCLYITISGNEKNVCVRRKAYIHTMHLFFFPLERSSADFHDKEQLYQIQDDFETSPCIYNRKGCSYVASTTFYLRVHHFFIRCCLVHLNAWILMPN